MLRLLTCWDADSKRTILFSQHKCSLVACFLEGHGDLTISNVRAGCLNLLHTVQSRVKPKYHIFGHIHEGISLNV